jgi:AAA domain-containing protein
MSETDMKEFKLDPADRRMLDDLKARQEKLGLTDKVFSAEHLSYSETVWYRIKTDDEKTKQPLYFSMVKDPETVLMQLRLNLRELERQMAIEARTARGAFHEFADFAAIFKAVRQCKNKGLQSPVRLVTYLADTGGGKSALCSQLALTMKARVVESRECWRNSYFVAARDIAAAVGLDTDKLWTPAECEDALKAQLRARKTVLAIDEGEYFGPRTINLVKFILNQTPTVIVLCAIPEAYERWSQRSAHEALQLQRRTHKLIRQEKITPDEADRFLEDIALNGDRKSAAVALAGAANQFGRFDLIARATEELRGERNVGVDDVQKAIARVRAFMGFKEVR